MNRKLIVWIIIAAMAMAGSVNVYAADGEEPGTAVTAAEAGASDAPEEQQPEDDGYSPFDADEAACLINDYLASKNILPERIGVSYCWTATGETCSVNGGTYYGGASLYKLTEMMALARMVSSGQYAQEDTINGMTITYIEDRCLTYSDNDVGENILLWFQLQLGGMAGFRRMQAEIAGVADDDLPADYYNTLNYSADFTMGVLKELYYNQETYPRVIDFMHSANDQYVKIRLRQKYDVAHKYGGGDGTWNIAAIVYSPTPFLVSIMSYHAGGGAAMLNDIIQLLADYTDTLDQRLADHRAELERQAEEARRAEEEARLAEEERQRREAEEAARLAAEAEEKARLEAEEAARLAAEAEEKARLEALAAEEEASRLERERRAASFRQGVLTAFAAVVILGVVLVIMRGFAKKKPGRRRAARRKASGKRSVHRPDRRE